MAFVVNMMARYGTRIPTLPIRYANFSRALNLVAGRNFSKGSYPVGPAPSEPLKPGDPRYECFLRNVEFFRQHGRTTFLSQKQMTDLTRKLSSDEVKAIRSVFESVAKTQEDLCSQMQQIDAKLDQILELVKNKKRA